MPSQRPSISEWLWRGLATRVAEPIIERGFWTQVEQLYPRRRVGPEQPHQLACLLLRRPAG